MSNSQGQAQKVIDNNQSIICEVISSAQSVIADLSANTDDRIQGGYILIEEVRVRRLISAVEALDRISLPTGHSPGV